MKIASWILTGIAYALLIAMIILIAVVGIDETVWVAIVFTAIVYCVPGYIGHVLISKHRRKTGSFDKSGLAVYILSFPPFIIPFVLLAVLALIVWALDAIIYLFTDHHYMFQFVAWVWSQLTVSSFRKPSEEPQEETLSILDDTNNTRILTFWGHKTNTAAHEPYTYAYRDDLGNFWLTTDKQNFYRRTDEYIARD